MNQENNSNKSKILGQIFTPEWIVNLILNRINYIDSNNILNKRILEPSFGEGIFLIEVVERYIKSAKNNEWNKKQIKEGLETDLCGVELDTYLYNKCVESLNKLVSKYDIDTINWNLHNNNFFNFNASNFDYIIGNPPYIKVHNIDEYTRNKLKTKFIFCNKGTIDTYIAFFEKSIRLLNPKGKLAFITPNSFMRNASNQLFRNYLVFHKLIHSIINFKSHRIFKGVNTYNCISILEKGKERYKFNYYEYVEGYIKHINTLNSMSYINKKFIFCSPDEISLLEGMKKRMPLSRIAVIQYGLCTQRDKIFISHDIKYIDDRYVLFNGNKIEKDILKSIVKASKMNDDKDRKIIFPYMKLKNKLTIIPENVMKKELPFTYSYLLKNKEELLERDFEKGNLWYEFGRNQSLQKIHSNKLVINSIINDKIDIKYIEKNVLMYSGIFISIKKNKYSLDDIYKKLNSEEFLIYVKLMGKDLQNGYKSLSTKIIGNYGI